jgi:hypothetical protein
MSVVVPLIIGCLLPPPRATRRGLAVAVAPMLGAPAAAHATFLPSGTPVRA